MSAPLRPDARSAVLDRIKTALKARPAPSSHALGEAWTALPRDYQRTSHLSLAARLDLLENRLHDYDAEVTRVTEGDVAAALCAILRNRGDRPTVVPPGFPAAWRPEGVNLTEDEHFSTRTLDRFAAVLTTATVAIAETGSLVLAGVPGQGRRATTLVPDFHLCVVRAEDVVESVPEAFDRLVSLAALPLTFVSGPSATADIEMTRIKGVHGPRFLHVLLVTSANLSENLRSSV